MLVHCSETSSTIVTSAPSCLLFVAGLFLCTGSSRVFNFIDVVHCCCGACFMIAFDALMVDMSIAVIVGSCWMKW